MGSDRSRGTHDQLLPGGRRLGEVEKRCWLVMEGVVDMEGGQIGMLRNGEEIRVRWTGLDEKIEGRIEDAREGGTIEVDEQEEKWLREKSRNEARRWEKKGDAVPE